MTNGQLLAQLIDTTRDLAHFYSSRIDEQYWPLRPEVNGKRLNSAQWTMAHLCWAQNYLLLKGCSDRDLGRDWMELVAIRSETPPEEKLPDVKTIKTAFGEIHAAALEVVAALTDEELEQPNKLDMDFKRGNSKRMIISHHIRHEGTHIGHLGWLAKIYGASTI